MVSGEVHQAEDSTPPIDIILPTHGRLEDLTIPCVNALYANTKSLFHLIVVDDSTPDMDDGKDQTPEWFRRLRLEKENITFTHSDTPYKTGNQLFNVGLTYGNSPYVATVMNSMTVEPDWDIVALQMMMQNPKIGIIGFKCLKLGWKKGDGQVESAGINMTDYIPCDMGRDEPAQRLSCSYPCFSVQWAFALLRREAALDNLDENVYNGFVGFDDIDNSLYLRYKGWEAWYCGLGSGYHRTHATRGSSADEAIIKNRKNAEIFYKRWGYWDMFRASNPYAPEYYQNGEVEFLCNANELPLTIGDK